VAARSPDLGSAWVLLADDRSDRHEPRQRSGAWGRLRAWVGSTAAVVEERGGSIEKGRPRGS
jgi:hypothetical protein